MCTILITQWWIASGVYGGQLFKTNVS